MELQCGDPVLEVDAFFRVGLDDPSRPSTSDDIKMGLAVNPILLDNKGTMGTRNPILQFLGNQYNGRWY